LWILTNTTGPIISCMLVRTRAAEFIMVRFMTRITRIIIRIIRIAGALEFRSFLAADGIAADIGVEVVTGAGAEAAAV